jgi:hypothetical protein
VALRAFGLDGTAFGLDGTAFGLDGTAFGLDGTAFGLARPDTAVLTLPFGRRAVVRWRRFFVAPNSSSTVTLRSLSFGVLSMRKGIKVSFDLVAKKTRTAPATGLKSRAGNRASNEGRRCVML